MTEAPPPKPITNNITGQFLIGIGMLILYLLITFILRRPESTTTEASLDFSASIGKSAAEIRDLYRVIPGEELHPAQGDEDLLPAGTQAEGFYSSDFLFYFFFDSTQKAIGFQVFDGLEAKELTLRDWEKIAGLFELKITHPPDEQNDQRVVWENEAGYRIEFTRENTGEFASKVMVIKQ